MSTVIHCPECGGVVGAKTTTEHGPPCTCFVSDDPRNDTDVTEAIEPAKKTCVKCGKDLTKQKRLKDSHGYWCVDCHKADVADKAPKGTPCPRCKRVVPAESFLSVDGEKMCSRCARQKRELKKAGNKKYRALDDTHFVNAEKKKLLIMVGVLIVLALIALYGTLR
jgi:DNA-directed RNA polymerase subunit RPC12/RpoP